MPATTEQAARIARIRAIVAWWSATPGELWEHLSDNHIERVETAISDIAMGDEALDAAASAEAEQQEAVYDEWAYRAETDREAAGDAPEILCLVDSEFWDLVEARL